RQRAGIGGNASGRDGASPERPQEFTIPVDLLVAALLHFGQGAGDTLVGVVDLLVDDVPRLRLETVLLVPDVERRFLEGNIRKRSRQSFCRNAHAFNLLIIVCYLGLYTGCPPLCSQLVVPVPVAGHKILCQMPIPYAQGRA